MSSTLGLSFVVTKKHYQVHYCVLRCLFTIYHLVDEFLYLVSVSGYSQTVDADLRLKCASTHAKVVYAEDISLSLFSDGRTSSFLFAKDASRASGESILADCLPFIGLFTHF